MARECTILDPDKVEDLLSIAGWSIAELARQMEIRRSNDAKIRLANGQSLDPRERKARDFSATARRAVKGMPLEKYTAALVARTLGTTTLALSPSKDQCQQGLSPAAPEVEWLHEEYLAKEVYCPNGLYYNVMKKRHRELKERVVRAKCYHLLHLSEEEQEESRHYFIRHAVVCDRIGMHDNIARNISCCPSSSKQHWWVLDTWVGERSLDDFLGETAARLTNEQIASILRQTATGLSALHEAGVIMRELTPWRILLSDDRSRAVITDFELAKLLESVPSVANQWKHNSRYRAPEIKKGDESAASDLYSLAVIAAATVNRRLPIVGREAACIQDSAMPTRLKEMLIKCLSPAHEDRLQEVGPLLAELKKWT